MLLRKGFCPCEHMNEWEKFNETLLSEKEKFCSNLHIWKKIKKLHQNNKFEILAPTWNEEF